MKMTERSLFGSDPSAEVLSLARPFQQSDDLRLEHPPGGGILRILPLGHKAWCHWPTSLVWEHNTHVGDARATDMAADGLTNVGQFMRERHADDGVALVGAGATRRVSRSAGH